MSFSDEQPGERCHKRYKFNRNFLARKINPEANLLDIMRGALAWTDLKMSYMEFLRKSSRKKCEKDQQFEKQMSQYYIDFQEERVEDTEELSSSYGDSDDDSDVDEDESDDDDSDDCYDGDDSDDDV